MERIRQLDTASINENGILLAAQDGRTETATDVAYVGLKNAILTCELAPATFVTESQLTESTGHGRGAIREALARLAMEGLVEVQPRRGYRVTDVSLSDLREVFEMRLLLEPHAAEQAAVHAPRAKIRVLHDLAHATFVGGDRASYIAYIEANREFHTRLAAAAGNNRLANAIRQLLEETQRVLFLSLTARSTTDTPLHEHHDLYDAVLEGDAAKAWEISKRQIENARTRILDSVI